MDINDNAPEFATEYEAFLCENGKPGQVSDLSLSSALSLPFFRSLSSPLMIGQSEL